MNLHVVIPVFNQVAYTRACIDSLNEDGISDAQIAVVDNGSTDGTREFLDSRRALRVIRNEFNRGCAAAWNQGVRALGAPWTVILNNDVLIPQGWSAGLLSFAEQKGMDIVSPAKCEGEIDYDFATYARAFMEKMARAARRGIASGSCFLVHERVFLREGLFDDDPRLGGYEDDEFFRRSRANGFRLGLTGSSFVHHFGSVTQKAIKATMPQPSASLGDRAYYREKYKLTWAKRQRSRIHRNFQNWIWRLNEVLAYGCTLVSRRENGKFVWR
jgi:GT2 family glycosyltransferase